MSTTLRASLPLLALALMLIGGADRAHAQRFEDVEARHLRHILVKTEAQADEVVAALERGESFVALARRYSYDVRTKRLGGDLGWVTRGTGLDVDFENAAFAIEKNGQWAKAKSVFGWFVVLLVDVRTEKRQLKPGEQPRNPRPAPKSTRDDFIEVTFQFEKKASAPGEDLYVGITLKNNTLGREGVQPQALDIPREEFWPLGLTLRMQGQTGGRNRALKLAGPAPQDYSQYVRRLEPGQQVSQRFRMQDYSPEGTIDPWPLVRVNWRGNILMANMNRLAPELANDESFKEMNRRWRFYYGGEQHLSILPNYPNGERWFAIMDINGGKVWIELDDPGIPGVIPYWMGLVRAEYYDRFPFAAYEPTEFILGGDRAGKGEGIPPHTFVLPRNWASSVREHDLDTVSLRVFEDQRGSFVGSSLYFCREQPSVLNGKAVPIGRVVASERTLELLMKAMVELRKTSLTRVDLYPESLIPSRMRQPLGLEAAGAGATPASQPKTSQLRAPKEVETGTMTAAELEGLGEDLPYAMLLTSQGMIRIELLEDHAPNTVAHFVELAESGFYSGLSFHRREGGPQEGFIVGGSSDGTGTGGLEYHVKDEISDLKHLRGSVALARLNSTPDTGGCQFYMCLGPMPSLDGKWTVFGRIVEGMEVADELRVGERIKGIRIQKKRPHVYSAEKIPLKKTAQRPATRKRR